MFVISQSLAFLFPFFLFCSNWSRVFRRVSPDLENRKVVEPLDMSTRDQRGYFEVWTAVVSHLPSPHLASPNLNLPRWLNHAQLVGGWTHTLRTTAMSFSTLRRFHWTLNRNDLLHPSIIATGSRSFRSPSPTCVPSAKNVNWSFRHLEYLTERVGDDQFVICRFTDSSDCSFKLVLFRFYSFCKE